MGDKTAIEWTDATWNPVTGCDRCSPGCDNCYALPTAARMKRLGQANYQKDGDPRTSGPGFGVTCHPHMLDKPLRWKRPRRIFVNSMSDLFHPDVPDDFIAQVFAVMALAQHHTFQVLTKRPQRMSALLGPLSGWSKMRERWVDRGIDGAFGVDRLRTEHPYDPFAWPLPNVWLGVSIENDTYSWRADHLRNTPAAVRFVSAEPLLGPLPSLDLTGIDWLIVGGESGPNARPMHPDWVRDLRDLSTSTFPCPGREDGEHRSSTCACPVNDVPFFFKQWGEWMPGGPDARTVGLTGKTPQRGHEHVQLDASGARRDTNELSTFIRPADWAGMLRVGKRAAGRVLDGRTWDETPEVARG